MVDRQLIPKPWLAADERGRDGHISICSLARTFLPSSVSTRPVATSTWVGRLGAAFTITAIFSQGRTGLTNKGAFSLGHLEKFISPSRCETDSLTARGSGRMERASHGAE